MKNLQSFDEFLNENLTENRIDFNGKTASDLYQIVKDDEFPLIFANNTYYSIEESELSDDLTSDSVICITKDGEESNVLVSDIEFVELQEAAVYVSPQEKERKVREGQEKAKEGIRVLMLKIQEDPENADVHKAALDIANAKQTVYALTMKLASIKEKKAQLKKLK